MNAKSASFAGLLVLLVFGTPAMAAAAAESSRPQAGKRLSEAQARAIAQRQVPNSAFEHAELEKAAGRKIWSIDLRPNGSNDIVEIHIDAYSGEVLETTTETPAQQRAERAEDSRANENP